MFPVNQVFKRGELYYRLLWLDGELSFWIDLYSKTAWPEQIAVTGIEQLLILQEITRVDDPCFSLVARSVEEGSTDWCAAWRKRIHKSLYEQRFDLK